MEYFTDKLIQAVRKRPVLYLINHPVYRDSTKKQNAWKEIQKELNEEVPALKAKWKNLKDTFRKFQQSKHSSSSQATKKLQNWSWAEKMSFLEPSTTHNHTESSTILDNESSLLEETSSTIPLVIKEELAIEPTLLTSYNATTVPATKQKSSLSHQINRRRRRININPTDKAVKRYVENERKPNSNDDKVTVKCDGIDLLFLGYADTFKNLSKLRQVNVKFSIAKILMEAELSDLEAESDTSLRTTND